MKVTIACTMNFLPALSKLTQQIQKKVWNLLEKYGANPTSRGINFEKIKSTQLRSLRVDQSYRVIAHQEKKDNTLTCLMVANHDDAYRWADNHRVTINPHTRAIQIFPTEIISPPSASQPPPGQAVTETKLFDKWRDRELLKLGVPEDMLSLVRSFKDTSDLDDHDSVLPQDTYIILSELAGGVKYEDLLREIDTEARNKTTFKDSLYHSKTKNQFVIIKTDESLKKMMDAPLGKWRVYLHPTQERLVKMNANGPMRVLGGAGTGKTVVAMHRARRLATEVFTGPDDKILFLVYSTNLAADVKANLVEMCTPEAMARIEVTNIDSWVASELRKRNRSRRITYYRTDSTWKEAIENIDSELDFPLPFIQDEFKAVVLSNGIDQMRQYLRIPRVGRGRALQRKQRKELWKIFEEYRSILHSLNQWESQDAMRELRGLIEKDPPNYRSVIVDEAQDLSAQAMILIRAIVPEQPNDLMIVGDAHQRIYKRPLVLGRCGINIRGRSRRLKINYRTPEEVRLCAVEVLKGVSYDDLDGKSDSVVGYTSLIQGLRPKIRQYSSRDNEIEGILEHVKYLKMGGSYRHICLVAPTNNLVKEYASELEGYGIPTYTMQRNRSDDRSNPGVRIGTMHRVKGLEFDHVIAAGVNRNLVPHALSVNKATDVVAREDVVRMARSLLYVVCTRARNTLFMSCHGKPSRLIEKLLEGEREN